jgi:hypothetical protein
VAYTISRLTKAGFRRIGLWQLDAECRPHFVSQVPAERGVYALIVNDEVRYVGSAQRGLHKRFLKYNNPNNKGTVAVRLRGYLTEALKAGSEVSVFLTTPPRTMQWNGLPIDLIAGLEEGLIQELQPAWNIRGLSQLGKLAREAAPPT